MTKRKILFVCLGNICRSPAAEEIARVKSVDTGITGWEFDSAGTYGGHAGEPADIRMRKAAKKRGYNIEHDSRQFRRIEFEDWDMIIVMDDKIYEQVNRAAPDPESVARIYRMTDFCTKFKIDHVPDPYYEGLEGFNHVLDILEDAVDGLFREITREQ